MTGVLVTGAGGNVGQHVVRSLRERAIEVVAAIRDDAKARALFGEEVATVRLDLLDRSTWADALVGVDRLFLVRPPAIADPQNNINPFVDLARERGVDHVVFLSVAGAGKNRVVPHRKIEDHLRLRGDQHTNLRPGFFAQNLGSASCETSSKTTGSTSRRGASGRSTGSTRVTSPRSRRRCSPIPRRIAG